MFSSSEVAVVRKQSPPSRLAPTDPSKRIEAVDIVRGFALFGVLLVNMYNFGAESPIWTSQADRAAFSVMRFFFETKSWRLFSFLFAIGFSLQLTKAQDRGGRFWSTYLRRLAVLFVIGMLHALLYTGDVLMAYAMLGLLLIPFSRVPPRVLLGLAVVLLGVFPLGGLVTSLLDDEPPAAVDSATRLVEARQRNEVRLRTHPYSVGSFQDVVVENSSAIPPDLRDYPLDAEGTAAYFAMFLLGLYAGKRRIVQDLEKHLPLIRSIAGWGLSLGVGSMMIERVLALNWGYDVWGDGGMNIPLELLGDLSFAYGSTALSLGYAASLVVLSRAARLNRLVRPLGPVGRLALTVYLTQTLAFSTLFYGYGFGRAFRTGPAAVTAFAVAIFGLQIAACSWWVRRFRFGPAEWLWRGLTYGRFPDLRFVGSSSGTT
jgi:uncharacterized protein